jgi:3-phosphoinositide dependent protein kinase-1
MLKKNNKEKNKNKKVHFDENQINENKQKRAISAEKKLINQHKANIQPSSNNMSSRMSTASIQRKTSIEDFTIIQELGEGSYGKVILAKHNLNGKIYALKKINKNKLSHLEKAYEVHIEKQILAELRHPNILKLHKTFQDKKHLYFALDYCKNKDLSRLINNIGKFDYKLAQFYAAEILSAIIYMHKQGVYHRDLKPENIGLDEDMHLKLFDFATSAKINKYFDIKTMRFVDINDDNDISLIKEQDNNPNLENNIIQIEKYNIILLSHLFVGTPEYVSPEVLEHNYPLIGPGVDIWAFGIMLYLFFTGSTPFKAKKEDETLENIKNVKYSLNNDENIIIPDEAKDLISKILVKDPKQRIGYNSKDYSEIKNHPFFNGINFENLEFEDPPISDIKEKLLQFGYTLPKSKEEKQSSSIINKLYDDKKDFDDDDENPDNNENNTQRLSENNFDDLKNNLKGEAIEHDIINEEEKKEEEEEDVVILEEKLQKKSPWLHYNTRIVKFFSKGHIDYFDPKTNALKGSFIINANCRVNIVDEYRFEIETINRNYFFKHKNKKIANEWGDKINYFISKCAEKKNK